MKSLAPKPVLLALTVLAILGAIAFIEFHSNIVGQTDTQARVVEPTTGSTVEEPADPNTEETSNAPKTTPKEPDEEDPEPETTESPEDRIATKEKEFKRAAEITGTTGYINTDGVSLEALRDEKVVLLEFWTYTCYNCQNAQPYISGYHDKYSDDGLQVIGVHTPEFGFEKDYNNVAAAVQEAGIRYPVVLDNNYATWNAYNNLYWPAWYLIDADGFIRYKHFGEGAYKETEEKIRKLLEEKDRT